MNDVLTIVELALMLLTLAAAVAMPLIAVVVLKKQQQAETDRLIARMEESLGASVKLLEVRNYYGQMSGEFKKMLDEAHKDGNRFRQDQIRKMIERLDQLKARTLDKTTKMLEQPEAPQGGFNQRRHRGRRGYRGSRGQGYQGGGQAPQPPPQQKPPSPPPPAPMNG